MAVSLRFFDARDYIQSTEASSQKHWEEIRNLFLFGPIFDCGVNILHFEVLFYKLRSFLGRLDVNYKRRSQFQTVNEGGI